METSDGEEEEENEATQVARAKAVAAALKSSTSTGALCLRPPCTARIFEAFESTHEGQEEHKLSQA